MCLQICSIHVRITPTLRIDAYYRITPIDRRSLTLVPEYVYRFPLLSLVYHHTIYLEDWLLHTLSMYLLDMYIILRILLVITYPFFLGYLMSIHLLCNFMGLPMLYLHMCNVRYRAPLFIYLLGKFQITTYLMIKLSACCNINDIF